MNTEKNVEGLNVSPAIAKPMLADSACPKCGCTDYEEWEELEYENCVDDPMYGGALVPMKFTRCGECS